MLKASYPKSRFAVITDENIYGIYGRKIKSRDGSCGGGLRYFTVARARSRRAWQRLRKNLSRLAQAGFLRSDLIIALGGGVSRRSCGVTAACYLRWR